MKRDKTESRLRDSLKKIGTKINVDISESITERRHK